MKKSEIEVLILLAFSLLSSFLLIPELLPILQKDTGIREIEELKWLASLSVPIFIFSYSFLLLLLFNFISFTFSTFRNRRK